MSKIPVPKLISRCRTAKKYDFGAAQNSANRCRKYDSRRRVCARSAPTRLFTIMHRFYLLHNPFRKNRTKQSFVPITPPGAPLHNNRMHALRAFYCHELKNRQVPNQPCRFPFFLFFCFTPPRQKPNSVSCLDTNFTFYMQPQMLYHLISLASSFRKKLLPSPQYTVVSCGS